MSNLTNAQLSTLKTFIAADPACAAITAAKGTSYDAAFDIAAELNKLSSPATKAWKTSLSSQELFSNIKITEFIARSAAERDGMNLMLQAESVDPSKNSIRKAIEDIFSGATNFSSGFDILNAMTETATRGEAALGGNSASSGTAQMGTVTAIKRNYVGQLSVNDILLVFNAA